MNKTFYLNPENEEAWEALENKSQWINDRLGGVSKMVEKNLKTVSAKATLTEEDVVRAVEAMPNNAPRPKWCEHGAAKGFCKYSKCKFS